MAILVLQASVAEASWDLPEGAEPFELDVLTLKADQGTRVFRICVAATWYGGDSVSADVHLDLPPGLNTADPTQYGVGLRGPHSDMRWFTITAADTGDYLIRERMRIKTSDPNAWYEGEWKTELRVRTEPPGCVHKTVREIQHSGKARYAYRGRYKVLIEGSDPGPSDVDRPPRLIKAPDALCIGCAPQESVSVSLIVTVGPDGRVKWPRRKYHADTVSAPVYQAAVEALSQWRYEPAMYQGQRVAHYAEPVVKVRTSRR
ncbi:MAG TPA: hypothetical protein VJX91_07460 [Candidatus Eisenbacteria bacterium]|nr:hypothetical protein [Candidatus Eisenbacteria bacterium]